VSPDAEDPILPAHPPRVILDRVVPAVGIELIRAGARELEGRVVAEVVRARTNQIQELLPVLEEPPGRGVDLERHNVRRSELEGGLDSLTRQHHPTVVGPLLPLKIALRADGSRLAATCGRRLPRRLLLLTAPVHDPLESRKLPLQGLG